MNLDFGQLRALSAAVSEGTLEAAARALHVTPSAISQRLRALEVATGRVLLVRSKPVRVTDSGRAVLRLARQVELLATDTAHELSEGHGSAGGDAADTTRAAVTIAIAVNADSLNTWILPALAPLATSSTSPVSFDLHREDQEHTATLLREGAVIAAITADPDPVPGCSSTRLGSMRYRPMAAPPLVERFFLHGPTPAALTRAPVVVFDRHDDLQHAYLRDRLGDPTTWHSRPPAHHIPSSADFLTAVRLGMGWGMLPDLHSAALERGGHLTDIDPTGATDVVLHWQQWKLRSPTLDHIAATITAAARVHLDP